MSRRGLRRVLFAFAGAGLLLGAVAAASRPAPLPPGTEGGFDILAFFDGALRSEGTVTTALVHTKAFTADFNGRLEGGTLRLDERFHFADGSRPLQRWVLRREAGGRLSGTVETEDAAGRLSLPSAVVGRLTPQGGVIAYDGFAPGGGATRLGFRHTMTRLGDGAVANRVVVRLLGLPLATSDVVFRRDDADSAAMR